MPALSSMNVWKAGQKIVEKFENLLGVLSVYLEGAVYGPEVSIINFEMILVDVHHKLIQSLIHFGFQLY